MRLRRDARWRYRARQRGGPPRRASRASGRSRRPARRAGRAPALRGPRRRPGRWPGRWAVGQAPRPARQVGAVGVRPAGAVVLGDRGPLGAEGVVGHAGRGVGRARERAPGDGRAGGVGRRRPGGQAEGGVGGPGTGGAPRAARSRAVAPRSRRPPPRRGRRRGRRGPRRRDLADVLAGGVVDVTVGGRGRGAAAQGSDAAAHGAKGSGSGAGSCGAVAPAAGSTRASCRLAEAGA